MTDLRTAAQQALEALEAINLGYLADVEAALRAALAQEQAEPFTPDAIAHTQVAWKMGYEARKAEEAEPVQEPVNDILRMAREAGFLPNANPVMPQLLARFAALARADERAACAQVCEDIGNTWALDCADAIRARSKA